MIPETHGNDLTKEIYRDMDYFHLSRGGHLCRFSFENGQLCLDFRYKMRPKDFDNSITVMSLFRFDQNELQSLLTFIDEHLNQEPS